MAHPLVRRNCKPKQGSLLSIGGEEHRLGGKLGDGAVGVVRRAYRVHDSLPVAIKFLAPDPKYIDESSFDDVAARFKREGTRGANLEHPCLVEIRSYEENVNGSAFKVEGPANPFICMEWVRGRSLESFIRRTHPATKGIFILDQQRLQIAIQIASALEYIHKRKIVHRDVKPANIFLTRNENPEVPLRAKLGDFGVVKWNDFHASLATGTLTATSQQGLGTLKYMAPEQATEPKSVSVRSDTFSFGITLFELLTGQVLASPHHVFAIMSARNARNVSVIGRYASIGYELPLEFSDLGDLILDMHRWGANGRPSMTNVLGHLRYQYYALFGEDPPAFG